MRFTFTRLFFILLALGLVPLSVSWQIPFLRTAVIVFDILLIAAALVDYLISRKLPPGVTCRREFDKRFAIGDPSEVRLVIENASERDLHMKVKDEYPSAMRLGESREAEVHLEAHEVARFSYFLTPARRGRYEFGTTAVRFKSRLGLVWCQTTLGEAQSVKVY